MNISKPKPKPNNEEPKNKTYLCILSGNGQYLTKNIIIATSIFDALSKYSTKITEEKIDLLSLNLDIEEIEIIR